MRFLREAKLEIKLTKKDFSGYTGTLTITGLRVSFSIIKSLSWKTNSANIKIWNLSQAKRNLIKDFGDQVTLYAGYQDDSTQESQLLFVGDTSTVSHIYEPPDIITVLECGDGERILNNKRVFISFGSDARARTIIKTIAGQMGLPIVEFADSDDLVYRQGYKFIGMGKDALADVAAKIGLQVSVQNNALQIIPVNGTIKQPIIQINENTGMQGIPQRFTFKGLLPYAPLQQRPNAAANAPKTPISRPIGYKVNNLLNPLILPGSLIQLTSRHLNFSGQYKVDNVRHEGDTFGPIWTTQLETVAQ